MFTFKELDLTFHFSHSSETPRPPAMSKSPFRTYGRTTADSPQRERAFVALQKQTKQQLNQDHITLRNGLFRSAKQALSQDRKEKYGATHTVNRCVSIIYTNFSFSQNSEQRERPFATTRILSDRHDENLTIGHRFF